MFIKSESLEVKVPILCLVTGCVSRPRDGRYKPIIVSQPRPAKCLDVRLIRRFPSQFSSRASGVRSEIGEPGMAA